MSASGCRPAIFSPAAVIPGSLPHRQNCPLDSAINQPPVTSESALGWLVPLCNLLSLVHLCPP